MTRPLAVRRYLGSGRENRSPPMNLTRRSDRRVFALAHHGPLASWSLAIVMTGVARFTRSRSWAYIKGRNIDLDNDLVQTEREMQENLCQSDRMECR